MADIATEIQNLSARISTAYDAVAAKGGTVPATKDTYHLSAAIDSIPAGGGGDLDAYMSQDAALKSLELTAATGIRPYAFLNDTRLTSVNAPQVTSVGEKAFLSATISSVNLPACKNVGLSAFTEFKGTVNIAPESAISAAFYKCTSNVDTSRLKMLYMHAFRQSGLSGMISLPSHSFSGTGHSAISCFAGTNIDTVSVDNLLYFSTGYYTAGQGLFGVCPNLSSVHLNNVRFSSSTAAFGTAMFTDTPKLQYAYINTTSNIYTSMFRRSGTAVPTGLSVRIDHGFTSSTPQIAAYAFDGAKLRVLDISDCKAMPSLANINALTGVVDIANLSVLVPKSLESQFKSATNWSNAAIVNHIYGV